MVSPTRGFGNVGVEEGYVNALGILFVALVILVLFRIASMNPMTAAISAFPRGVVRNAAFRLGAVRGLYRAIVIIAVIMVVLDLLGYAEVGVALWHFIGGS